MAHYRGFPHAVCGSPAREKRWVFFFRFLPFRRKGWVLTISLFWTEMLVCPKRHTSQEKKGLQLYHWPLPGIRPRNEHPDPTVPAQAGSQACPWGIKTPSLKSVHLFLRLLVGLFWLETTASGAGRGDVGEM